MDVGPAKGGEVRGGRKSFGAWRFNHVRNKRTAAMPEVPGLRMGPRSRKGKARGPQALRLSDVPWNGDAPSAPKGELGENKGVKF